MPLDDYLRQRESQTALCDAFVIVSSLLKGQPERKTKFNVGWMKLQGG
jgi:hypothetical protein